MIDGMPWEIHPDLQEDRLCQIAAIIRDVRHDALGGHEPKKGDSNWGLGTRVHERTCHAIRQAAQQIPWLKILEPGLHFVFTIGKVPVRFYRGEAENPNPRYLSRRFPEITAQQFAFDFAQEENDWFWRLAIETEVTGEVLRIVLVQVSASGQTQNPWEVPFVEKVAVISPLREKVNEGVELEPPFVGLPKKEKKKSSGENV